MMGLTVERDSFCVGLFVKDTAFLHPRCRGGFLGGFPLRRGRG